MSLSRAIAARDTDAKTFTRRDLHLWMAGILFAGNLPNILNIVDFSGFASVSIFQYLGWYAVFRLLWYSAPARAASGIEIAFVIALFLVDLLPGYRVLWLAATTSTAFLLITAGDDAKTRAAATVLAALAAQGLWGPVLFNLLSVPLLNADAAIVGVALEATQNGIAWHGNVIELGNDKSLEVYNACSSFHNISLAMLCWVTLTKLERPNWVRTDFLVGAFACVMMILFNACRLYLMARNFDAFEYWHTGTGAEIFAVTASIAMVAITRWGASIGSRVA